MLRACLRCALCFAFCPRCSANTAKTLRGSWPSRSPAFRTSKASPITTHHQAASQANGKIEHQGMATETGLSLAVAQTLISPPPPGSVTSASRPDSRPLRMHPFFTALGTNCVKKKTRMRGTERLRISMRCKDLVGSSRQAGWKRVPSPRTREARHHSSTARSSKTAGHFWNVGKIGASRAAGMGPEAVLLAPPSREVVTRAVSRGWSPTTAATRPLREGWRMLAWSQQ